MRSISQLRAAAIAGEPLTAEELEYLAHYEAHAGRLLDALRRTLPPDEQTRAETGTELEEFLADAIAAMDALAEQPDHAETVAVALARMRELVVIVRLQADALARATGLKQRQRRENRARQPLATAAKLEKADELLEAIDEIRTRKPALSDAAAARVHVDTDPAWATATDTERAAGAAALARRIRIARKRQKNTDV